MRKKQINARSSVANIASLTTFSFEFKLISGFHFFLVLIKKNSKHKSCVITINSIEVIKKSKQRDSNTEKWVGRKTLYR